MLPCFLILCLYDVVPNFLVLFVDVCSLIRRNVSMEQTRKQTKIFCLLGNIFASREANFVSATMFPWVGREYRKQNQQLCPGLSLRNITCVLVKI